MCRSVSSISPRSRSCRPWGCERPFGWSGLDWTGLVGLGAVREWLPPADDENESCVVMQDIEGDA
ncbi:hypothetical protein [Streptomyces sp. NPDC092370]|uniref:hypothetical protein n=1 Tax=Streptomyces sp. NPDC092370 TaxID=3366016 RepID=UPI003813BF5C